MKARIARKVLATWPASHQRYRKSTFYKACRRHHFKVIDSPNVVCLYPAVMNWKDVVS